MALSSAYVTAAVSGKKQTWRFAGVTSMEHVLSLDLDSTASREKETVTGARNRPDRITLSVVETDTARGAGRSACLLEDMNALKRNRIPCRVLTTLGTYRNMLLTEITAVRDSEIQDGWRGTLVFTECGSPGKDTSGAKPAGNSSVRKNTGTAAARKVTGSAFLQLLQRAGVNL